MAHRLTPPTAGTRRRPPARTLPLPPPAHPWLWRLDLSQTRPAIGVLCRVGFIEADERRRDGQLAELVRIEDGAQVTVARGAGGDVLLLPSRPWPLIARWEHPAVPAAQLPLWSEVQP